MNIPHQYHLYNMTAPMKILSDSLSKVDIPNSQEKYLVIIIVLNSQSSEFLSRHSRALTRIRGQLKGQTLCLWR